MKRSPSRKLHWPAVLLMLVIILPILIVPSFAWSGTPLCNKVNVFVGDTQIIRAGESIQDSSGAYIPASVLCGDMVYLSVEQLIDLGVDFSFERREGGIFIQVEQVKMGAPLTTFPTVPGTGYETLGTVPINTVDFMILDQTLATMGEGITYHGVEYPASFYTGTYYIPVWPIYEAFGVNTVWDVSSNTLYIGGATGAPSLGQVSQVGLSNFTAVNSYYEGRFSDVPSSAWYSKRVGMAYEYGLMTGSGTSTFNPEGNISIAETITIACQIYNTYYSNQFDFPVTDPWYVTYIKYAFVNDIVKVIYSDYTAPITRAEFASILAGALPSEALAEINSIEDGAIPDVSSDSSYYNAVYTLYRAGVISGSDTQGTFNPNSYITRAEAATILSNLVNTSLRSRFTLVAPAVETGIGGLEALRTMHNQYGSELSSIFGRINNSANLHSLAICQGIYDDLDNLIQKISNDNSYNQNDPYIIRYKNSIIHMRDGMKLFISNHTGSTLSSGMKQGLELIGQGAEEQVELITAINDYISGKINDLRGY